MSNNCFLKIAHINVRSLNTGFDVLRNHMHNMDYDIMCLSETWLNSTLSSALYYITDYVLIRCDRPTRGGGVAMYIKSSLKFDIINSPFVYADTEVLWVRLKIMNKVFIIGVVYKPPRANSLEFSHFLEDSLSHFTVESDYVICTGDFNVDMLNLDNTISRAITNTLDALNLKQIINEPTRYAGMSAKLLDVMITQDDIVESSGVTNLFDNFDHCLIHCTLKLNKPAQISSQVTYRDFKYFNYDSFLADYNSIDWSQLIQIDSIDDKTSFLVNNIVNLFDLHAPFKTIKIYKKNMPWITDNIKLMMKLRNSAFSRYKRNRSEANWNYYKQLRNYTTGAIKREKKAYFEYRLGKTYICNVWSELRQLDVIPTTKRVIPDYLNDVDEMNNHFSRQYVNNSVPYDVTDYYKNHKFPTNHSPFSFELCSCDEVEQILYKIKSKATGTDNLSITMLRVCAPHIIPHLVHIFNSAILAGKFPTQWKHALITPVAKVDSPTNYNDLRPISILPVLSKIFENILHTRVKNYVNKIGILPIVQSGFRPGHSTSTALSHIVDDILSATDNGKVTVLILLDYSKAFDTINHSLLCTKLKFFNFNDSSIMLLSSYLHGREQCVRLNNKVSSSCPIPSGVPQGSILGPMLFSLYTSDMCRVITTCAYHFYADDTQLYYSFNPEDVLLSNILINRDLEQLVSISSEHSLSINSRKSAFMVFGSKRNRNQVENSINITVNGSTINRSDVAKNLGIFIDNDLRFNEHISSLVKKSFCTLKMLWKERDFLSMELRKLLTNSLILSRFSYCDEVYGPCIDKFVSLKIQKIQNACIRFIYGLRKYDHISRKLYDTGWLNMRNRRYLHLACLVYKVLHSEIPHYLFRKLIRRFTIHAINTRFKQRLHVPKFNTSTFKQSFTYNAFKIFNEFIMSFTLDTNANLSKFKNIATSRLMSSQM